METNPNPILHFNEQPGASPDYRFDYVETNINLGTSAPPVARNKGFTRIDFGGNCSNSTHWIPTATDSTILRFHLYGMYIDF